jgi:hypothetical protein
MIVGIPLPGPPKDKIWPNRFRVRAKLNQVYHKGFLYENLTFNFYRVNISEEEAKSLLTPLGFTHDMSNENYLGLVSQVKGSFSEDETIELMKYLNSIHSSNVYREQENQPELGYVGIHELATPKNFGFFNYFDLRGYPLDFDVAAFYYIEQSQLIGIQEEWRKIHKMKDSNSRDMFQIGTLAGIEMEDQWVSSLSNWFHKNLQLSYLFPDKWETLRKQE